MVVLERRWMVKYTVRAMILGGIMLLSGSAWAIPMPDFILYGLATGANSVSAYWHDKRSAKAEMIKGHYKLAIPMDTESAYKSGDVIELWVNGAPLGRTEMIGKAGEARKLDF